MSLEATIEEGSPLNSGGRDAMRFLQDELNRLLQLTGKVTIRFDRSETTLDVHVEVEVDDE